MPHFFISYRRSDTEGSYLAHMVCRELRRRYGPGSAFLDVDSRRPGLSFPVKVEQALKVSDVVLVIIGPLWLQLLQERQGDPRDWVRYEVAESLKRESLPVVPVCRTGVEVPRAHELPEELQDLSWRDGITLDPFQDFDTHLGRLLSDLEVMLEASLKEKEELRVAKEKLIVLLRWRAHQLELAAARAAAAAAQAAERAAREKAEAEARAAKWTELATMAEERAAQEKTARRKEAAEEPAPAPPVRGALRLVPAGPIAAPKPAHVSEGRPQVAPAKPAATSGAASKPTAPKYYQPSNRYTFGGVVASFLVSGLVIFVLAFGYSYSLLGLPFVQINPLLTFLYGVLCGVATGLVLEWRKVRSAGTAAWVGLASGFVAIHLSWAVWIYGHLGLFKGTGFSGLLRLIASPAGVWRYLYILNRTGSWGLWGYRPTGGVLWFVWVLEALLILGLSALMANVVVEEDVFCETCGTWCEWQFGARLRLADPAEVKRHLEVKDFAHCAALGIAPAGATPRLELSLKRCKKCGTMNALTATVYTQTTNAQGRRATTSRIAVKHLLLTAAECNVIQNLGRGRPV